MEKNMKERKYGPRCFGYPLSIFFIVINEFCERFSYYGMRAVLVLYFKYFLRWDDNLSTAIYHTFVALCYLTPILGAIVADSWLGKFMTIISLSIVYTIGQVIMAVSSINDLTDYNRDGTPDNISLHIGLSMIGLILIAFGTGGIKPCVAAFGGDQFDEEQEKQRSRFFSLFYLAVNAGSLLSTIITPILRGEQCGIHTKQQCYPLAFGVPAALMAVSLMVFILGSNMYKKGHPEGNIMLQVSKCIGFAIKNRFKQRSKQFPKREHWLDWASEKYDKRLIVQTKMVLKVLFLYIPLPMFWALFDQQGSRWTLQATTMDGNFGAMQIQPDQMQTVNPILIVIMVPVVDAVIYPLIKKCHINFTPLRKITVGMFLASLAFVAAALVQVQIDKTLPDFPKEGQSQIKVINLGTDVAKVDFGPGIQNVSVESLRETKYLTFDPTSLKNVIISYGNETTNELLNVMGKERHTLILKNTIYIQTALLLDGLTTKSEDGKNKIRFINNLASAINITMDGTSFGHVNNFSATNYTSFTRGVKEIVVAFTDNSLTCKNQSMSFGYGSAYTIVIQECNNDTLGLRYVEDIQPNTVHMAWQIPQYFIITCGEVVFSVTGLSFSYSQAPSNMKSVLQAGWLLTVAVGNIIVLIVAGASKLSEQWAEYVLFAALLMAVCIIFSVMAYFYTYVDPAEIESQIDDEEKKNMDNEKWPGSILKNPISQTEM
ncbi:solute carrier family 15 member 1 [Pelodiscus sinensis]|uniref:solute carrier family 15 member 1 n=1 Tax=Pelodiscus sinensis TaxID=13735 RepID=UPI0003C4AF54|nr:solute carrier family 15 member 1 [Pelodiscus sinensis]|eukprot:XP_006128192.1 solute carrier family 15 member 1 [Pelodiscus sinensis]